MEKKNIFKKIWLNHYFRFILFGLALSTLPTLVSAGVLKTSMMGIIGGALIFAMAALGLNLLLGYSGLISLGTAGFMGLGAYISAYVTVDLQLPWELCVLYLRLPFRQYSVCLSDLHHCVCQDFISVL